MLRQRHLLPPRQIGSPNGSVPAHQAGDRHAGGDIGMNGILAAGEILREFNNLKNWSRRRRDIDWRGSLCNNLAFLVNHGCGAFCTTEIDRKSVKHLISFRISCALDSNQRWAAPSPYALRTPAQDTG